MAKHRRLSSNRMLAERFRAASDPKEVARLGAELGRMVFGGWCTASEILKVIDRSCGAGNLACGRLSGGWTR
jgi:hypothetical protein